MLQVKSSSTVLFLFFPTYYWLMGEGFLPLQISCIPLKEVIPCTFFTVRPVGYFSSFQTRMFTLEKTYRQTTTVFGWLMPAVCQMSSDKWWMVTVVFFWAFFQDKLLKEIFHNSTPSQCQSATMLGHIFPTNNGKTGINPASSTVSEV